MAFDDPGVESHGVGCTVYAPLRYATKGIEEIRIIFEPGIGDCGPDAVQSALHIGRDDPFHRQWGQLVNLLPLVRKPRREEIAIIVFSRVGSMSSGAGGRAQCVEKHPTQRAKQQKTSHSLKQPWVRC